MVGTKVHLREARWVLVNVDQPDPDRKGRRADGQPSDHRYEPPRDPFITKYAVLGAPDLRRASTSHVERQNLTMRMQIRRLTRLCNGFSKKLENHRAAISLYAAWYNFCRVHEALRVTPAMEAGLTDHVWSVEELVAVALSEPAGDPPRAKPLAPRPGAGPARQTTTGRVLRLVHGGSAPAAPAPVPAAPPAETPAPAGPVQLDLLAWRPRDPEPRPWRPMEQLPLFLDE
jgi:hypothetical protein